MQASDRVQVPGSDRELVPEHQRLGDVDPREPIEISVYLRPRTAATWVDDEAARTPAQRRRMTREQWADAHGADPADVAAVRTFAERAGLTVTQADRGRRSVHLRGALQDVAAAFEANVTGRYTAGPGGAEYRGRSGALTVPAELDGIVTAVLGIDSRPQARLHLRAAAAASPRTRRSRWRRRMPSRPARPGPGRRSGSSSSAVASAAMTCRPTSRASA